MTQLFLTETADRVSTCLRIGWLAAICFALGSISGASAQETYKTPEAAVTALVEAIRSDGTETVLTVLGPDGSDIASSGDDVADAADRQAFIDAYDAKHSFEQEDDDTAVLLLGEDDWPFPIPIVRENDVWVFDTEAGREEILSRRIGRNELDTIQACLAYVDAQNDFAEAARTADGLPTYAQKIVSDPDKKNGLYWPASLGGTSPLGDLVAKAAADGYKIGEGRAPYRGYYYKVLTRQGPSAPGGAFDYTVDGKMIGGFALVAYPAEYQNSGVMTFLVNHDGIVYQKDLGEGTSELAEAMTEFNPDDTWAPVDTDATDASSP